MDRDADTQMYTYIYIYARISAEEGHALSYRPPDASSEETKKGIPSRGPASHDHMPRSAEYSAASQ